MDIIVRRQLDPHDEPTPGAVNVDLIGDPQAENEGTDEYDQPEAITVRCKDEHAAWRFADGVKRLIEAEAALPRAALSVIERTTRSDGATVDRVVFPF